MHAQHVQHTFRGGGVRPSDSAPTYSGYMRPVIDLVFVGEQTGDFLDRAFSDSKRFGEMVHMFDATS
jgi:hypothetical protein